MLRLVDGAETSGAIRFEGKDLCQVSERTMRGIRGTEIAMIFQEPMTALNPLFTVGNQIGEVLETHLGLQPRTPPANARSSCCGAPASRSRSDASTAIRISSRAASASAP